MEPTEEIIIVMTRKDMRKIFKTVVLANLATYVAIAVVADRMKHSNDQPEN